MQHIERGRQMKNFIIILIFFSFLSCSAQNGLKVIPNKTDSLRVSWNHPWLDLNGNPEHVLFFEAKLIDQKSNILYSCHTPHDSLNFRPQCFYTFFGLGEGIYYASVTAVDLCGNKSSIHLSADPTAKYGGWYSLIDFTPPAVSFNLSP